MRRSEMKKLFQIAVVFVIAVSMIAGTDVSMLEKAYAADKDQEGALDEIAEQFADPENILFDYTTEEARQNALKLAAEENYPEKFDLSAKFIEDGDENSYITPVKFQNPWGNCWGFAAIAAAESSILGDDELKGNYVADIRKTDDPSKVQLDLSEKQLTYFALTALNDPSSPQNGEGNVPISPDEDPVSEAYNIGAHAPTASEVMASGIGPVLESENELFKYKGKNSIIQKQWIDGKYDKYCYSSDDDWAIDEDLRFSSSFTLAESFKVPSPRTVIEHGMEDEYEFNPAGIVAMKKQLMQNRALEIGYKDDTFNPVLEECGDYISGNWAQYTFEVMGARHAVTVVGWDDNYPRENFRHKTSDPDWYSEEDTMPPADMFPDGQHKGATNGGNGAWLVKNSWGSGEEEFPNKGEGLWGIENKETGKHTGYFWLSYYDKSIDTPEAVDFQVNEKGTAGYTDTIDQHDFSPIRGYFAAHVQNKIAMANVFKAAVCEDLKEVGCDTSYPGTEVQFDVYLLGNGSEWPTDGLHVSTVTSTFEYAGFHKVKLPEKVRVMRGQKYAIVVTQTVPSEQGLSSYAVGLKLTTGKAIVNKGESMLLVGDEWYDLSKTKVQDALLAKVEGTTMGATNVDNFAIKGYAEETPDVVLVGDYSGDVLPVPDDDGNEQSANFIAWITDNTGTDDYDSVVPEWKLAEGGEDVIEVKDGRDPTRKTVFCKKYGWTYLTVSADNIGTFVFSIKPNLYQQEIKKVTPGKNNIRVTVGSTDLPGIGGYEIFYKQKKDKEWVKKDLAAPADTLEITGLKAGKTYEVKARIYVESPYGRYWSVDTETEECEVGLKNPMKASGKTVKVDYKSLKKKDQTIKRAKAIKVSGAKGKVTYKKVSVNKKAADKKITIKASSGKITVKKGLAKGTYKLKVQVKAAGGSGYASATQNVTVKIKVK